MSLEIGACRAIWILVDFFFFHLKPVKLIVPYFLACTWTRLLSSLYGNLCWWLNLYFSWWLESNGVTLLPFRDREDNFMASWISLLIVLCIPWDFIFHMLCGRLIFSFFFPIAWWVGKMDKLLEHFSWLWSIERNTDSSHFLLPNGDVFNSRWFHYDVCI